MCINQHSLYTNAIIFCDQLLAPSFPIPSGKTLLLPTSCDNRILQPHLIQGSMDQMSAGKTPGEESSPAERQEQRSNSAAATTAGDGGEHESEEAERQRIERLGRERPPKLKSFGAELFFCYSVIASQFMAVSCSGGLIDVDMRIELGCRNISCLGSMSSFQPF